MSTNKYLVHRINPGVGGNVNGAEQIVQADGALEASPGNVVQVRDVTICAASFVGDGGEACAEVANGMTG